MATTSAVWLTLYFDSSSSAAPTHCKLHPSLVAGAAASDAVVVVAVPLPSSSSSSRSTTATALFCATADAQVDAHELVLPFWVAQRFGIESGAAVCASLCTAAALAKLSPLRTAALALADAAAVDSGNSSGSSGASAGAAPPPTPLPTFTQRCSLPALCRGGVFALSLVPNELSVFEVADIATAADATAPAVASAGSVAALHPVTNATAVSLRHATAAATSAVAGAPKTAPAPLTAGDGRVVFDELAPAVGATAVADAFASGASSSSTSTTASGGDGVTDKLRELTAMIDTFFSVATGSTATTAQSPAFNALGSADAKAPAVVADVAGLAIARTRCGLLTGVSGVGKSYLCERLRAHYATRAAAAVAAAATTGSAVAPQSAVQVVQVSAHEVLATMIAADNRRDDAAAHATPAGPATEPDSLTRALTLAVSSPSVLVIDDLDSLLSEAEGGSVSSAAAARASRQLLSWMDAVTAAAPAATSAATPASATAVASASSLAVSSGIAHCGLVVIGTARSAQRIPSKYLRAGRFDHVWPLPAPTLQQRERVLAELLGALVRRFPADDDAAVVSNPAASSASASGPSNGVWSCLDASDAPDTVLEAAGLTAAASSSSGGVASARLRSLPDLCRVLARLTPAYVLRDLNRLVTHAVLFATQRCADAQSQRAIAASAAAGAAAASAVEDERVRVVMRWCDFAEALQHTRPAPSASFDVQIPRVSWQQIGGYEDVKRRLKLVVSQWRNAGTTHRLGFRPISGVLLHGPSGTGKTLLAHAIASDAALNFIAVSGSDLFSKYFGESERLVRQLFARAREAAPCVILLDEIDAVAPARAFSASSLGGGAEASGGVGARVLSTLLNEMDGVEKRGGVYILAATNRLAALDAALVRAGRLDELIRVAAPSADDHDTRAAILHAAARGMALHSDVDLHAVARATPGLCGAELAHVCRTAALIALRTDGPERATAVRHAHFVAAVAEAAAARATDAAAVSVAVAGASEVKASTAVVSPGPAAAAASAPEH